MQFQFCRCLGYENHEIEPSVPSAELSCEESAALGQLATALTVAANCSHRTPPGLVARWLSAIKKTPLLFRSKQIPPEVLEAIAQNYRRGTEAPGTHIQDVFSNRRIRFPNKRQRPTPKNIARAARAALTSLHRPKGRPRNVGNRMAAEFLASTYRVLSGRRIVRHQTTTDLGHKRLVDEDGPFFRLVEAVIGPLQKHLKEAGLAAVTVGTIVRIATEDFQY